MPGSHNFPSGARPKLRQEEALLGISNESFQRSVGSIALVEEYNREKPPYEVQAKKFQADEEDVARNEGHIIRSDN